MSQPLPAKRPVPRGGHIRPNTPQAPLSYSPPALARPKAAQKRALPRWLFFVPIGFFVALFVLVIMSLFGLRLAFANTILPNVQVGDVELGGLNEAEAAQVLATQWDSVVLRDEEAVWTVNPAVLGLTLDANLTAQAAFAQGHGEGGMQALFSTVQVAPIVQVDSATFATELERMAETINSPARNAGVAFENGQVLATPPQTGRIVNVAATLNALQMNANRLIDGELPLVMAEVQADIMDSTPLVAQAQALLANPLDIQVYDPVSGDSIYWSVMPQEWGTWLSAVSSPTSPLGIAFSADETLVRAYLTQQVATLGASRSIDIDDGITRIQNAIQTARLQDAAVVIQHQSRVHTVQAGETMTSIAWNYGMPYLYIQQVNNGIESLSVGQEIVIPPADTFLDLPIVPNKRIEVSISEQRVRVYENNQLKWDWVASTGINSSPTWTGVYQILSHEQNAYAANWDLWMPNFMGVYQPIPNADFTNGFHGFPTRGGGQLLWENSLGRKVTYGCILLSNTNVQALYAWAETGVVVEITP